RERDAAHMSAGMQRKSSGSLRTHGASRSPNTTAPVRASAASRRASPKRSRRSRSGDRRPQRVRTGATPRAPATSPSHQVSQIAAESFQLAYEPRARLVTPTVALTVVARNPARAPKLKMSRARSNASEPFANRVTSHAPRTPSSVLPVAMPSDVHRFPAVVAFARNAPSRIAGQ